jgi:NAD(P)-dependent dehydrogenase (short-subunit alcohol dehydrogenase family)
VEKLLDGQVAVITGGASGIGRAIALRFAREGAHIVVADVQREPREGGEPTDRLVERDDVQARFVHCDVTRSADVEAALAAADELGGIDILVNNAGIFRQQDVLEVTEAEYDLMMEINVKSVFFASQAAAKRMATRGGGSIVNLCSVAGEQGSASIVLYCASKGAVRLLTYGLAQELAPLGIRVNALHPGIVETTMTTLDVPVVGTEAGASYIRAVPLGRNAQPADVAEAALYFASSLSSYVTGASLRIDGGLLRV